jgi:putative flavoprotein involved in K+ transport
METKVLNTIVIGAGQSGLSASFFLKKHGLEHIVFEKGKIGESWRSQRWDGFLLNTTNSVNLLPGINYSGDNPDGFYTPEEFVHLFESHAELFQLPVSENSKVISVEKADAASLFKVIVERDDKLMEYHSRHVIIASGNQNQVKFPGCSATISKDIKQLHSSQFRNAAALPEGAVLVVGGAQSGIQIAEILAKEGKKVYLSSSKVGRVPRRYRGKDIVQWLIEIGFFDLPTSEVPDPAMLTEKAPQLSGSSESGHTVSYQLLASKGVTILGRLKDAVAKNITLESNAALHVQFADECSQMVKSIIDGVIAENGIEAPPAEHDPSDVPDIGAACASSITDLNLEEHNITSIIWAAGYNPSHGYIKLPVFSEDGKPIHTNGISKEEGLYFLGLPWLRLRKSELIYGVRDDAEFIVNEVYQHSTQMEAV